MLEKATRVCQASFGMMIQFEAGTARPIAFFGVPQAYVELAERGGQVSDHAPVTRVARTKQIVHVADFTNEYAYAVERHPMAVPRAQSLSRTMTLPVIADFQRRHENPAEAAEPEITAALPATGGIDAGQTNSGEGSTSIQTGATPAAAARQVAITLP
jgi:hypothetical protein